MKIVCIGYRSWALKIYRKLKKSKKNKVFIFTKVNTKKILKLKPDYILFYGWSWKVKKNLINTNKCIMLHPSMLPKFRGGSPIQNQIIQGITKSGITLFRMNNDLDQGNILLQKRINLSGSMKEIFEKISNVGFELTEKLIRGKFKEKKQPKGNFKIYKRRKPKDSLISMNELKTKSAEYLYNKIRMLQDPYPNAYIVTKDNKKLLIKKAEIK